MSKKSHSHHQHHKNSHSWFDNTPQEFSMSRSPQSPNPNPNPNVPYSYGPYGEASTSGQGQGQGQNSLSNSVTNARSRSTGVNSPQAHPQFQYQQYQQPMQSMQMQIPRSQALYGWNWNASPIIAVNDSRSDAEYDAISVDIQDDACDTSDLDAHLTRTPFVINFSNFGENVKEFNLHIGLRRQRKRVHRLTKTVRDMYATTDDYSQEVIRFLKNQPALQKMEFVIEVHVDDDKVYYKVYDEILPQGQKLPVVVKSNSGDVGVGIEIDVGVGAGAGVDGDKNRTFNVREFYLEKSLVHRPIPKAFLNAHGVPTALTIIHVELPGLSSSYLGDWKHFFEMQTGVKILICNFGSVLWTFYAETVLNNEETLQKIVLRRVMSYEVTSGRDIPLDFRIFEKCNQLAYLKITGGGYRGVDRWSEWTRYGRPPAPGEVLIHTHFLSIAIKSLVEFHYSHITINQRKLEELAKICRDKKLRLICRDCPDHEYYDGDYNVFYQEIAGFGDATASILTSKHAVDDAVLDIELAMLISGYGSTQHAKFYKIQNQRDKNPNRDTVILVLTLSFVVIVCMVVIIVVAIFAS